jgi:hypothetical protein
MGAANRGSPLSMAAFALTLRPAQPADIGAVMAIERLPDFELCVARSEEGEHRAMLDSPSHAYRLGVGETGAIEAFAILRGLGDVHGNLYLKRVAVARPGQGLGTAFLSLVLDEAFGPLGAERFYLDCFADRPRRPLGRKRSRSTRIRRRGRHDDAVADARKAVRLAPG